MPTPQQQAAIDAARSRTAALERVRKVPLGGPAVHAAIGELGLQALTASIAEPIAGLAGIGAAITPGGTTGGDAVRNVREALTYQPRSPIAQGLPGYAARRIVEKTPEVIKGPIRAGVEGYQNLADKAADRYGPAAGAAVTTLPTAIMEAIPGAMAIRNARRLPVPEPRARYEAIPEPSPQAQYQQVGNAMRSNQQNSIIPQIEPDPQIMQDAQTLGIDLNPSHYSTSRAYRDMEQALKSRPGSLLSTQEEKAILDLGTRADELIEAMGGSTDRSMLDMGLKQEFDSTIASLANQAETLYTKVNTAIPRATRVAPDATRQFISQQLADLGGDEAILTAAEKRLLNLTKENPTYAALDRVRKDIGSAIGNRSGPYKDDEVGQLRQIYAVLLKDQERFADAFGAGDDYRDASSLVRTRKDIEDRSVALFGREVAGSILPRLRQAGTGLTRGDTSALNKIMEAVPESRRQEVAAYALNELFTSGARRNAGIGQGFMGAFSALNRNSGAKSALFKYLPPEAQERFDMIGRVATGIYRSKALENNSKTARDVILAMENGGLFSRLYGVGRRIAIAEGASTSMGVPGAGTAGVVASMVSKAPGEAAKRADELLSSAAFRDAARDYAVSNAARAERRLRNTPEYNAWLELQDQNTKAQILATGLIPWLTQEER